MPSTRALLSVRISNSYENVPPTYLPGTLLMTSVGLRLSRRKSLAGELSAGACALSVSPLGPASVAPPAAPLVDGALGEPLHAASVIAKTQAVATLGSVLNIRYIRNSNVVLRAAVGEQPQVLRSFYRNSPCAVS